MRAPEYLKMILALVLLALIAVLPAAAQTETETEQSAATEEGGTTSLWMVKGEKNTVYIAGSYHMLKKESYPLPDAFDAAYEGSQVIAFEANLDELKDPELAQNIVLAKGLYPEGVSLKQALPAELYEQLWQATSDAGMDIEKMQRLKPWIIALQLASTELSNAGYKPEYGVDYHYFEKAKMEEKEQVFFETAEFQIDLFAGLGDKLEQEMLARTLSELDQVKVMADEMRAAWRTGDVESLDSLMLDQFKEFPRLQSRLLTQRNKNWVPLIEEMMAREENCLVIVGTLHLIGNKSVIEYLRANGHEVVQM